MNNEQDLLAVAKALNSPTRLDILRLLNSASMNIKELAAALKQPISSTAFNVDILQKSGLILAELQYSPFGQIKLCSRNCDEIGISLFNPAVHKTNSIVQRIPIGNYFDYTITAPCGIVTPNGNIGHDNEPDNFFDAKRHDAGLLWFTSGYVEYRVNRKIVPPKLTSLEISFEACSEAPFYRNNWLSDITVWLNGREVTTWTSPGDFGGRAGKQNPEWWSDQLTQFGVLNNWIIKSDGTYLSKERVSPFRLADADLESCSFITLRIGVKENAKYRGGINLFGSSFGDYDQDILVQANW
jgi:predicted transcriptional regulator